MRDGVRVEVGAIRCSGQLAVRNYKTIQLKCALAGAFNYNNFRILLSALLHLIIMKIAGHWIKLIPPLVARLTNPNREATPFIMSLFVTNSLHGAHFAFNCTKDSSSN